jgi:hypothetical protein
MTALANTTANCSLLTHLRVRGLTAPLAPRQSITLMALCCRTATSYQQCVSLSCTSTGGLTAALAPCQCINGLLAYPLRPATTKPF